MQEVNFLWMRCTFWHVQLLLTYSVLGDENDEGVKCEGKAWVTSSDRATSHSVLCKSPKCCEIAQDIVQIMTTIAGCSTDHFRQNEATLQGACVNQCGVDSGAWKPPEPASA